MDGSTTVCIEAPFCQPNPCGVNEECNEDMNRCQCLSGYIRNENGTCEGKCIVIQI